jgi:hypothetical protein
LLYLHLLPSAMGSPVHSPVRLGWQASADAAIDGKITGYKIYYSLQDFTAPNATNFKVMSLDVGLLTAASVSNVVGGLTYYFAVTSVDSNGDESDFSNVASFTVPVDLPPFPEDGTTGGIVGGGATTTGSTTGGGGSTGGGETNSITAQVNLLGMLPRLWLYPTNGQAVLAIQGTVGATFAIQSSTNPAALDSWTTITNIKLSAIAPNVNPTPGTTLEKAFIPALESFQDPTPVDGMVRYYRIYMPMGYAILANQVLTQQGYDARLIAVRCPGLSGYIVCYVTQETAYLDYNDKTYIVKLEACGPTIRQVASKVAATLSQNWTSASEFTVADDGTKFLFATVVKTDDPSTDPLLGVPRGSSSDILIDF